MNTYDIIIKNGKVIDGTGNPWFYADVGVRGTTIASVGDLRRSKAIETIDADGRIVCPGFIDAHSHSDISYLVDPRAISKISQGVTTEIIGHCGGSLALAGEKAKRFFSRGFDQYNLEWTWNSVADYLSTLEARGLPVNIGAMVGSSVIRASLLGFDDRSPTDDEMNEMTTMVDQAMRDGAFGLSSGLKYAPGCYAATSELVELCRVVSRYGGVYATHIRNQGDGLFASIDEAMQIGRQSGVSVHVAHLKIKGRRNWGQAEELLATFDRCRADGVDITFDQYPYPAASCDALAFLPKWVREGGVTKAVDRLKDPAQHVKIEKDLSNEEDWKGSEKTVIAEFKPDASLEGKSLHDVAAKRGIGAETILCDLLVQATGELPVIFFVCDESDLRKIMTHPLMMVGSDGSGLCPQGPLGKGKPHPRNYGAFTRFLRKYVLDGGLLTVEDAIRRMTSFTAQRFGIRARGLLREGMKADILIIDEAAVADRATYENPHQLSNGIDVVLVNGSPVLTQNTFHDTFPGETLRHSGG